MRNCEWRISHNRPLHKTIYLKVQLLTPTSGSHTSFCVSHSATTQFSGKIYIPSATNNVPAEQSSNEQPLFACITLWGGTKVVRSVDGHFAQLHCCQGARSGVWRTSIYDDWSLWFYGKLIETQEEQRWWTADGHWTSRSLASLHIIYELQLGSLLVDNETWK